MLCQDLGEYRALRLPDSLVCESHRPHLGSFVPHIWLETFHPYVKDPDFLGKIASHAVLGEPLADIKHGAETEAGLRRMARVLDVVLQDPSDYKIHPVLFFDDVATVGDNPGEISPARENVGHAIVIAESLGLTALASLLTIAPSFPETESYYLDVGRGAIAQVETNIGNYPSFRITPKGHLIDNEQPRGSNLRSIKLWGKDGRPGIPSCDVMDGVMQGLILLQPFSVGVTILEDGYQPQQQRALRLLTLFGKNPYPPRCVKAYHDKDGNMVSIDIWSPDEMTRDVARVIADATDYAGEITLVELPKPIITPNYIDWLSPPPTPRTSNR